MEFNYKQFKYKTFQFLSIVEMIYPNTRLKFYNDSYGSNNDSSLRLS